eukprot:104600_1
MNNQTLLPTVSTSTESPIISTSVSQTPTSNPSISSIYDVTLLPIRAINSSSLPTNSPLIVSTISRTNSPTNNPQNIINEHEVSELYSTTNNPYPGQQNQKNTHAVTLIDGVIYIVIGVVVSCCIMFALIGIVIYYCFHNHKHSIFDLNVGKKHTVKDLLTEVHIRIPAL